MIEEFIQFEPEVYKERRDILISELHKQGIKDAMLLILGHPQPMGSNSDHPISDYQTTELGNSNFLYYIGPSGLEASACAAAIVDVQTGIVKLFGDPVSIKDQIWTGDQVVHPKLLAMGLGLKYGGNTTTLEAKVSAAKDNKKLHYMPMIASDSLVSWSHILDLTPSKLRQGSSKKIRQAVTDQRMIKSPEEIHLMTKEGDVTTEIHKLVIQKVRSGKLRSELEVGAFISEEILKRGKLPSFPPIVTTNGAILHNRKRRKQSFKDGELLLLDFGTKDPISSVCADQTSTIPVATNFLPKQKDIYSLVQDAHQSAKDACVLGERFENVHKAAAITITQGLLDLGLLHGASAEELVSQGVHKLFFPHGLGHAIGLDTHDMGDQNEDVVGYPDIMRDKKNNPLHAVRFNRLLEVGHCFTIEPGIYFNPILIKQWKEDGMFAQYINRDLVGEYAREVSGIRYEECYYMSAEGCEKLGITNKPASIEDIKMVR